MIFSAAAASRLCAQYPPPSCYYQIAEVPVQPVFGRPPENAAILVKIDAANNRVWVLYPSRQNPGYAEWREVSAWQNEAVLRGDSNGDID